MNLKLSKIVKHFLNILKCVEKIKLLFKGTKINFLKIFMKSVVLSLVDTD